MSDLTKKLSLFFESECKTLTELDTVITESVLQKDWLDAVALFRKGMIALQKNDLNGLESIQAANEALKKVVDAGKREKTDSAIKSFNESVEKVNKENLTETLANMKFAFTSFYASMKDAGYKELVNESNFYTEGTELLKEDGEDDDIEEDGDVELEEETPPVTPPMASEPAAPTQQPVSNPSAQTNATPVMEETPKKEEEKKRSAYHEGFEAGRASWHKDAKNHKELLETTITQGLTESPYSYVTRFSEGFAAGFEHEKHVQEDLCPECFKQAEVAPEK